MIQDERDRLSCVTMLKHVPDLDTGYGDIALLGQDGGAWNQLFDPLSTTSA